MCHHYLEIRRCKISSEKTAQVFSMWIFKNICILLQLLWKYSKDAVELHLQYLSTVEKGAETHSVIVTDIPGTEAGKGVFTKR